MKGCFGIYEKSLIVVFVSASSLWKYKEFKIFQASKFSKLGIKVRNPALFLQQEQKVTAFKVEEKCQETN